MYGLKYRVEKATLIPLCLRHSPHGRHHLSGSIVEGMPFAGRFAQGLLINSINLPGKRDGPSYAMRVTESVFFTARFARDVEFAASGP